MYLKVETESASWELENGFPKGWNNGLVIEDEIGNQFVWIPNMKLTDEYLIKYYKYTEQDQEPLLIFSLFFEESHFLL